MSDIESILKTVRREVWIITSAQTGRRGGLTATWVSQASLDSEHPLLVVGLAVNHFTCELVSSSRRFVAHLLSANQTDLAWQFASGSGRDRDKFLGQSSSSSKDGIPILDDCPAWLDCRVIDQHDAGDRRYFWAEITAGRQQRIAPPLTDQQLFVSGTSEQLREAKASLLADLEIQKPLSQAWRDGLKRGQSD